MTMYKGDRSISGNPCLSFIAVAMMDDLEQVPGPLGVPVSPADQ